MTERQLAMTGVGESRFVVRTITSITRWNESVKANIDRLVESGGPLVESVIVNKVGARVTDYLAAADSERCLAVVDGVWKDFYSTWAQFEAPPDTWTICLHDDDAWSGGLVPQRLRINSSPRLLVLPTMFDPFGVKTTEEEHARALAEVGAVASPTEGMCQMAHHPFPAFYAYTPAIAWNSWREFVLSRPVHLPHLDWQLNFAAAALSMRIERAELAYFRDNSNWSTTAASRASLSRLYQDLGLSAGTAQLDSLVSSLHTLALTKYLPVSSAERQSAVHFALALLRTRKRRLARLLRFLPEPAGVAVGRKAYEAGSFSVDLSHHTSLASFFLGKMDLRTVGDVRDHLIPACRLSDPSAEWASVMDQLDRDLADLC